MAKLDMSRGKKYSLPVAGRKLVTATFILDGSGRPSWVQEQLGQTHEFIDVDTHTLRQLDGEFISFYINKKDVENIRPLVLGESEDD